MNITKLPKIVYCKSNKPGAKKNAKIISLIAVRLIWFHQKGYFPEHNIDHKWRHKDENKIENLREASQQCNLRNYSNPKNNTSGVKGVCFDKTHKQWFATIHINRKQHYLGESKNFDEAVLLRFAVEQCLDWERCDKMSPAHKYAIKYKLILEKQ